MSLRLGIRLHGGLDAARCVALAQAAEALGYAGAWFAENPLERGVLTAMAAAAAATTHIELGVGVWNPFLRHPVQIAMDAGALDELAGGRVTLGIGSGLAVPIVRAGIDNRRPIAALKDTFHIVRRLLQGESVTYKGSVFSVADVKLSWRPRRPKLPILLAARGPQALALAGRIADGLMVSNMCPPGFAAFAAGKMRAAAETAGRAPPARVVQYLPCVAKPDRAQAIAELRPALAGMLRTFWALAQRVPAARTSLVAHSGIPETDFATTVARPDAAMDERFVEAFALAGTAEDCRARLAAYEDAGVTDIVPTFVGTDPVADMAYLAEALAIGRAAGREK